MTQEIARHQIKPLTGIRGLAALYVVAYHIKVWPGPHTSRFINHGYLAVDLFFVLSGFVMGMSYAEMFAEGFSSRHYGTFLVRRLARVYPLYLLITCIYGFAMLAHLVDANGLHPVWWPLLTNILMIQAWGLTGDILGPAWSISTEWAAYLLFPVLAATLLFSRWRVTWGGAAFAFLVLIWHSLC